MHAQGSFHGTGVLTPPSQTLEYGVATLAFSSALKELISIWSRILIEIVKSYRVLVHEATYIHM